MSILDKKYCGHICAICGVECDKFDKHNKHLHEDWCEAGAYEGYAETVERIYPIVCGFCKSDNMSIENAVPDLDDNKFHIFVSCNNCSKYYRVSLEM